MFRKWWDWFLGLFAKGPAQSRPDLFDPEDKLVYTYLCGFDNQGNRLYAHRDPMQLWVKIADQAQIIDADAKVARSPSKGAAVRYASLIRRLREVFEVKSLEEGGLPDSTLLKLFSHFMTYAQGVKKNSPLPSTTAQETLPATPSSTAKEELPTSSISDSPSTASVPSTNTPTPCDSELASPTERSSPEMPTTGP